MPAPEWTQSVGEKSWSRIRQKKMLSSTTLQARLCTVQDISATLLQWPDGLKTAVDPGFESCFLFGNPLGVTGVTIGNIHYIYIIYTCINCSLHILSLQTSHSLRIPCCALELWNSLINYILWVHTFLWAIEGGSTYQPGDSYSPEGQ